MQAMKSVDAELWTKAMDEEMESLKKNGTWEEVELPQERLSTANGFSK